MEFNLKIPYLSRLMEIKEEQLKHEKIVRILLERIYFEIKDIRLELKQLKGGKK